MFCRRCGAPQPVESPAGGPTPPPPPPRPAPPTARDIIGGIQPRTASILCYVPGVGWIASIIVLAAERFRHNREVRFHGFQGLYLFVAYLLEDQVMRPIFARIPGIHLHALVSALLLGMSIFMMVKASHDETYSLPLFGELAEKSMAED